jgi:hypothetical protein
MSWAMRVILPLALIATASGLFAQAPSATDTLNGTWTLDRAASARVNLPATELTIAATASQVTIRRHWTSDAGVGDGLTSTDVLTVDGRASRLADGRTGSASI